MEEAPNFAASSGQSCPLFQHQAETWAALQQGQANVIFNTAPTGAGKTLAALGLGLCQPNQRTMALYPTIELIEDQVRSLRGWHERLGQDFDQRVEHLYGEELSRRVVQGNSSRFEVLAQAIQQKPLLLTNPDIFHLIAHFRYRDPHYSSDLLPLALADFPHVWVADEFHLFGAHQEAAMLNTMVFLRAVRGDQRPYRFVFTSATPNPAFQDQLQQAGFEVQEINCRSVAQPTPGYALVAQPVTLEFVQLTREQTASDWLLDHAEVIRQILQAESPGRGLVILNSLAQVTQVARQLRERLPEVMVREISGRMDRRQRAQTQALLHQAPQPVLVVATSAADVGVDFRIHLLITEGSNSATVIQRLGRVGRHPGFGVYRAYVLIAGSTPWVSERLRQQWQSEQPVARPHLVEIIRQAFDPPPTFPEYQRRWGALQAQGLLWQMRQEHGAVFQQTYERMVAALQQVYGQQLQPRLGGWRRLADQGDLGRAIQQELLRFRGGTTLQAAVWDEHSFYTYDLLRLLPYVDVELLTREDFLQAVESAGFSPLAFPPEGITLYLRVRKWREQRLLVKLQCHQPATNLRTGELTLLTGVAVSGPPHVREISQVLARQKLLAFLVPLSGQQSANTVRRHLGLSALFGLYDLQDGDDYRYACAFNQDALLLEALKSRLTPFLRNDHSSLIF
ncbi:MAG: type I-D CRISPR-associated helicase Cas3' [Gloeomargarita sp. GMQP_bins_14]